MNLQPYGSEKKSTNLKIICLVGNFLQDVTSNAVAAKKFSAISLTARTVGEKKLFVVGSSIGEKIKKHKTKRSE